MQNYGQSTIILALFTVFGILTHFCNIWLTDAMDAQPIHVEAGTSRQAQSLHRSPAMSPSPSTSTGSGLIEISSASSGQVPLVISDVNSFERLLIKLHTEGQNEKRNATTTGPITSNRTKEIQRRLVSLQLQNEQHAGNGNVFAILQLKNKKVLPIKYLKIRVKISNFIFF